jgi:hypothetical protein
MAYKNPTEEKKDTRKQIEKLSDEFSKKIQENAKKLKTKDTEFTSVFLSQIDHIVKTKDYYTIKGHYRVLDQIQSDLNKTKEDVNKKKKNLSGTKSRTNKKLKDVKDPKEKTKLEASIKKNESKTAEYNTFIADCKVFEKILSDTRAYLKQREIYSNDGGLSRGIGGLIKSKLGLEQTDKITGVKTAGILKGKLKTKLGLAEDENFISGTGRRKIAKKGLVAFTHIMGAALDAPILNLAAEKLDDRFNLQNEKSLDEDRMKKARTAKMNLSNLGIGEGVEPVVEPVAEKTKNETIINKLNTSLIANDEGNKKSKFKVFAKKEKALNTSLNVSKSLDESQEGNLASGFKTYVKKQRTKGNITADKGFKGVVSKPTSLNVAQDGKPEHVQVTPGKTTVQGDPGLKGSKDTLQVVSKLKSLATIITKDNKTIITVLKETNTMLTGMANTLGIQLDIAKDETLKYKRSTIGNKESGVPKAIKPEEEDKKKTSLIEKLTESLVKPLLTKLVPQTGVGKAKLAGGVAGGALGAYGGYKAGGWASEKLGLEEGGTGEKVMKYGGVALGGVGGAVAGNKLAGKFAQSKMGQKLASKIPGVGGLVSSAAAQAMADQKVYVTNAEEIGEACKGSSGLGDLIPGKGKGIKMPGGKGGAPGAGFAEKLGSGIGSIGKGLGEGIGGFLKGLASGLEALGTANAMKGAVTLGIIGGALWLSGKGFKLFQELDWEAIGKGTVGLGLLAAGVVALGSLGPMAIAGAAAVAVMSGALWMAGKGFKEFQDLDWETIGKGIVGVGALALGAAALAPLAPAIGIGALALGALGLALRMFPVDRLVAVGDIFPKVGLAIKSGLEGVGTIIEKIGFAIQSTGSAVATGATGIASAIKVMSESGDPLKLIALAGGLAILTPALIAFAGAAALVGAASKGVETVKSLFGMGSPAPAQPVAQTQPTTKTQTAPVTQKDPAQKEAKKSLWGGWFANGGSYDVDKPTLLGVGEAGEERIQITPTKLKDVAPSNSSDEGDAGYFVSDEEESLMKQQMQVYQGKQPLKVIIQEDLARKELLKPTEHKIGEKVSTPIGELPIPEIAPIPTGLESIKGMFGFGGAPGGGGTGAMPKIKIGAGQSSSAPSFGGATGGGSKPGQAVGAGGMSKPPQIGTPGPVGDVGSGPSPLGQGGGAGPIPAGGGMSRIVTKSGKSATVATQYASQMQGFISELESTGYQIKSLGGYANRNMVGGDKPSYHALGAAIDINPSQNPYYKEDGRPLKTDMPSNTGAIAAKWGMGWGGNWSTIKDAMHFSVAKGEGGSVALSRSSAMPSMASAPSKGSGGGGSGGSAPSVKTASAGASQSSPAPAKDVQTTSKGSGGGGGAVASASKSSYDMDSKNSSTISKQGGGEQVAQGGNTTINNTSGGGSSSRGPSGPVYTGDNTSFPARLSRLYS